MSDMVMKVATAIWCERPDIPGAIPSEEYMTMARAAIEAMREPTDAMKTAGGDTWVDRGTTCAHCAGQIYGEMIGAALK